MKTVVKITKTGFSSTVGSGYGFGSWTIGATGLEVAVEIDLTTDAGKQELKKISDSLAEACIKLHESDVNKAKKLYPELAHSIARREQMVNNEVQNGG